MTVLAGIFSPGGKCPLTDDMCDQLHQVITRRLGWAREEYRDCSVLIVKIDAGAFREPAFLRSSDGAVSALVGEPILETGDGVRRSRTLDLEVLQNAWVSNDLSPLQRTHGSFAGVFYRPTRRLSLVTDKLGSRCMYYWRGPGVLVFATAIRVLKALSNVTKAADLQGLTEASTFGYPLMRRTPYMDIHCLDAGEIVHFDSAQERRDYYWRWDTLPQRSLPAERGAQLFQTAFRKAVARRLRPNQTSATAFLSGGLDSRCIVTALVEGGTHVHSVTLGSMHQLDQVIASHYAEALGTAHHGIDYAVPAYVHPTRLLPQAFEAGLDSAADPEGTRLVWSGDGGSGILGYVHLTEELVRVARERSLDETVRSFLNSRKLGVPASFLTSRAARAIQYLPQRGMREHLESLVDGDPARALYWFLILNHQRRHLFDHLEDLDLTGIELITPFFDSDVIEACSSIRVEDGLRHLFYHKCLEHFPGVIRSVAWQAYPGHLPSPLPVPEGEYQWGQGVSVETRRTLQGELGVALRDPRFPRRFLKRTRLLVTRLFTALGIRDYSWLFRFILRFYRLCASLDTPLDFSVTLDAGPREARPR